MYQEYHRDHFTISTDPSRLDVDAIHAFLTRSYWAEGIPRDIVARSLRHALCFGLYDGDKQIGLARVVSDFATYAYLADVYILEAYRGRGLGKWLMACVVGHPDLQGLRRWSLATRDAHGLYRQFGFTGLKIPERHMEILDPEVYKKRTAG
ncbi:MAG TPA: GNAT family N-acetyltransferase [Anaerolineales bacterium]|nr:GNAT family N-acetyltransferase [Anaerolineales bacterium]